MRSSEHATSMVVRAAVVVLDVDVEVEEQVVVENVNPLDVNQGLQCSSCEISDTVRTMPCRR
jgi:hypothetical protein